MDELVTSYQVTTTVYVPDWGIGLGCDCGIDDLYLESYHGKSSWGRESNRIEKQQ